MKGRGYHSVFRTMFMRLYNYITGDNRRQSRVTMTVPVITRVTPCKDFACQTDYSMSFYMSAKEGQPPLPYKHRGTVSLTAMPEMNFYVASFEGIATQRDYEKKVDELINLLPEDSVDTTHYYCVSYDTPYMLPQNYNEIWLLAKPSTELAETTETPMQTETTITENAEVEVEV